MKRNILAYLGIVLFAIAPLLVTTISFSMAHVLGCPIDEASNQPCIIFGLDWGSVFYVLVVFGWFTIVTVPLGAIALVGLTIFLAVKKIRNHAAQS
jgi:Na+/H+ antiporter NhaD/arsenite permease-like protein